MRWITFLLAIMLAIVCFAKKSERRALVLLETSKGNITVELYNETPLHRDNFLSKVKSGFYDGLLFHRVIQNFMIQGGDPESKDAPAGKMLGDGEAGDPIPAEFRFPKIYHRRGAIAMAREGDAYNPEQKSSSCQFYIVWGKKYTNADIKKMQERIDKRDKGVIKLIPSVINTYKKVGGTPHLDGAYTVFGRVVKGLTVVDQIQQVETDKNDRPVDDVKIIRAKVLRDI